MDADDISHATRLEKQICYLNDHSDVVAVGTNLLTIDPDGTEIDSFEFPEKDLILRWMQLFDCPVSCGAVLFKKDIIWDQLGGFDPSIRYAQDWELWSRVLPKYRLANVQEYLLDVREHPGASSSASNKRMLEEQFRINRMNPGRILGIENRSTDWFEKVDTLLQKKVSNPEDRLGVINIYFDRFCRIYPEAFHDRDILRILAEQYLKLLYHTEIRSVWRAISGLAVTGMRAPAKLKQFPLRLVSSIGEIPSHVKYWTGRNLLNRDI